MYRPSPSHHHPSPLKLHKVTGSLRLEPAAELCRGETAISTFWSWLFNAQLVRLNWQCLKESPKFSKLSWEKEGTVVIIYSSSDSGIFKQNQRISGICFPVLSFAFLPPSWLEWAGTGYFGRKEETVCAGSSELTICTPYMHTEKMHQ